ncbi:hypothetical protein MWU54_10090 [Marivita sp. S6314]|uniref:hypothetical protein n=1 Tax=Marivita sp. S6314 TaxID=2926406 RepID=UPI001FF5AA3C|nr:hypothetical protein [Marivita sp. S6314]MCK0150373.1 hypothetical protein [Marivita sp. S6314]
MALTLMGIAGAVSVAAAAVAVSPKVNETMQSAGSGRPGYFSLLTHAALENLRDTCPDVTLVRAHLHDIISPADTSPGFVSEDHQIAMVLAQIMARWEVLDAFQLNDDQARELWFLERLLRASPAEAGAMAECFASPDVVLAMKDRVAADASA